MMFVCFFFYSQIKFLRCRISQSSEISAFKIANSLKRLSTRGFRDGTCSILSGKTENGFLERIIEIIISIRCKFDKTFDFPIIVFFLHSLYLMFIFALFEACSMIACHHHYNSIMFGKVEEKYQIPHKCTDQFENRRRNNEIRNIIR